MHVLVVTDDGERDRDYAVVCPGVTDACRMWVACSPCKPGDGERLDDDEPFGVAHGVEHQNFSWGWSVPSGQCFVRDNEGLYDVAEELALEPGRYPVEHECEDESYLVLHLATKGARR